MEYYRKIQCYKPAVGIIDEPVRIEEIALLQNSVEKNILGRIKFVNQSTRKIIAIFVQLQVKNIALEILRLGTTRYIYQDIIIHPGELYGNTVAIDLPNDTRLFWAELEKVVFEDGSIWEARGKEKYKHIPQEKIEIPKNYIEKTKQKLSGKINNLQQIKYYYEEGLGIWECSCGKVNSDKENLCSFCMNERQSQKAWLSKTGFAQIMKEAKLETEEEKRKLEAIRELERQKEQKEREEQRTRQEVLIKEQEKKTRRKRLIISVAIAFLSVILSIILIAGVRQNWKNIYEDGMELESSGQYKLAAEKYAQTSYPGSEERLYEVKKKLMQSNRDKLMTEIFDSSYDPDLAKNLSEIVCLLGLDYDLIEENSTIDFDNLEYDEESMIYECEDWNVWNTDSVYSSYRLPDQVGLKFGDNDTLVSISFVYDEGVVNDYSSILEWVSSLLGTETEEDGWVRDWWSFDNEIFSQAKIDQFYGYRKIAVIFYV